MAGANDEAPPPILSLEERLTRFPVIEGGKTIQLPNRSRSLATAVSIFEDDVLGVLGGQPIEYDEMAKVPTLGRRRLDDVALTNLRLEIERRHVEFNSKGQVTGGIQISRDDVYAAVCHVAARRSFHPVREYLRSLTWDHRERLAHVPELLCCDRTELNVALLRRWFISGVARPMQPGCKVDTVPILTGAQGAFKSSFFRVLASDRWFSDSTINLGNRDAYVSLEGVWIYEWAELDALSKKEMTTVRSFITSKEDKFRRPYARTDEVVKRDGVIVGTTNAVQFLRDETGARRFWPIRIRGRVELEAVREQRDQLWAEAVHAYDRGEPWHLTDVLEDELKLAQEQFRVTDVWADQVLAWARDREDFKLVDVFGHGCLNKPTGQLDKRDKDRAIAILRGNDYEPFSKRDGNYWRRKV